jgi:putative ABC transport system substrate-binding protein
MVHATRRQLIALLGGGVAIWPLAARAQQPGKLPTIGVIAGGTPSSHGQLVAALVQRFVELGWAESRTAAVEVRWAEGHPERFAEFAAEFVRLKVDVIVTSGLAVPAVRQVTSVIPIVFAGASEPVATGIVASLARPGGNVTACRCSKPIMPARDSSFFARWSRNYAGWRSSVTSALPERC